MSTPTQTARQHSELTTYVSLQEAVAHGFGAYSTLRLMIDDGRLPAVKIGGRVKIATDALEALAQPKAPRMDVVPAIQRIVEQAPPLTPQQRERLAVILGGGH